MKEWTEAMTRIGNTLGLEGRFLIEFGYQQIETKVSALCEAEKTRLSRCECNGNGWLDDGADGNCSRCVCNPVRQ